MMITHGVLCSLEVERHGVQGAVSLSLPFGLVSCSFTQLATITEVTMMKQMQVMCTRGKFERM